MEEANVIGETRVSLYIKLALTIFQKEKNHVFTQIKFYRH